MAPPPLQTVGIGNGLRSPPEHRRCGLPSFGIARGDVDICRSNWFRIQGKRDVSVRLPSLQSIARFVHYLIRDPRGGDTIGLTRQTTAGSAHSDSPPITAILHANCGSSQLRQHILVWSPDSDTAPVATFSLPLVSANRTSGPCFVRAMQPFAAIVAPVALEEPHLFNLRSAVFGIIFANLYW